MGFVGGSGGGCQAGRRFHFDFTSPATGQCCPPVMEPYTFLAFLAFTPAATWFLRLSDLVNKFSNISPPTWILKSPESSQGCCHKEYLGPEEEEVR